MRLLSLLAATTVLLRFTSAGAHKPAKFTAGHRSASTTVLSVISGSLSAVLLCLSATTRPPLRSARTSCSSRNSHVTSRRAICTFVSSSVVGLFGFSSCADERLGLCHQSSPPRPFPHSAGFRDGSRRERGFPVIPVFFPPLFVCRLGYPPFPFVGRGECRWLLFAQRRGLGPVLISIPIRPHIALPLRRLRQWAGLGADRV